MRMRFKAVWFVVAFFALWFVIDRGAKRIGLELGSVRLGSPTPVRTQAPVARPSRPKAPDVDVSGAMSGVGDVLAGAWAWIAGNGHWLLAGGVVLAVWALVAIARNRSRGQSDPQRAYTGAQREEIFSRAGGRCEYISWGLARCGAPAEHADHLWPWSKGGATSVLNGVASCAHHNTSKGAKILPRWQVAWLVARRRSYFPDGVGRAVGEWYSGVAVARDVAPAGTAVVPEASGPPVQTGVWEAPGARPEPFD